MYRQIWIHPTQTQLQRVLWRDNVASNVQTYELKTVIYGTSAAPCLATRTLKYLAETHEGEFLIGSQHVSRDFYVDHLLTDANTIKETLTARDEIIKILNRGLFKLNK